MKKGNVVLISVCIIILIFGLISMPKIYKYLNTKEIEDIKIDEEKKETKKATKITLDSEILKELVYPNTHNDTTNKDTYYKLDKLSITDFSNNDILYNAFLQIYSGYLVSSGSVGCSKNSVSFSSNYLESRIKNIFGPNTGYNLTDFTVPNGVNSNYVGTFKYDSKTGKYIYYGDCNSNKSNINYYDVKDIYSVDLKNDDNELNVYYYVAFLKIENNKYTLYRDYNYSEEISSGEYKGVSEITQLLSKLDVKKYQYTFRKDTCNYDSYCFYEGKWING